MTYERLSNETDAYRRRLLLIGHLTENLRSHGVIPVVVGGHAVEIYTFQDYATHDVDLVVSHRELVGELLESWGFQRLQLRMESFLDWNALMPIGNK